VRQSADGGDLFFGSRGRPEAFWPTVWPFLGSRLGEVGERSVAQKLKLVFYSDD
jgi:hypothetical protein